MVNIKQCELVHLRTEVGRLALLQMFTSIHRIHLLGDPPTQSFQPGSVFDESEYQVISPVGMTPSGPVVCKGSEGERGRDRSEGEE